MRAAIADRRAAVAIGHADQIVRGALVVAERLDGAVDGVDAVLGGGFRHARRRIEGGRHAPGTGIGFREQTKSAPSALARAMKRSASAMFFSSSPIGLVIGCTTAMRKVMSYSRQRAGFGWASLKWTNEAVKPAPLRLRRAPVGRQFLQAGAGAAICRSQPSKEQGMHGSGFARSRHCRGFELFRSHPTAFESTGRPRPPDTRVARAEEGHRPATGGGGKMGH